MKETKEIKATSPYSIRLNAEERNYIRTKAEQLALKDPAFIRLKIFDDNFRAQSSAYQKKGNQQDHKEIAQVLAMLGQSRIANNLNQIAKAINTGTLVITPEIESQLTEACLTVQLLRTTLIKGMGIKED
jgi:hypothetical protein